MKKSPLAALSLALVLAMAAFAPAVAADDVTPFVSVLKGDANFMSGYDPVNLDGTINAVVEIPAGTTAKYDTNVNTGMIELEQKNGKPRFVQYLGYPCNYGHVPRSILLKSKGGDGDALDVCVLGPVMSTGAVVKARAIGVLTLLDNGEVDDKLIAVAQTGPFATVSSISDLDKRFPGVTAILQTWFTSYKGYGKDGKLQLSSPGFKGRAAAIKTVGDAVLDFETSVVTDADRRPLDEKGNPYLYRWPGAKNIGE
ncbi:MAG: inorganic diphosphatase [Thermoanaerobaculia bacterium]